MTDTLSYTTHASTIGTLLLVAGNRGLRFICMLSDGEDAQTRLTKQFGASAESFNELPGFFASSVAAIDHYLAHGGELALPVDLAGGTPLQRMVWLELQRIPYGETISYTTLSERVGFPRAVRAVASACGANPLPLVIPCHRVLSKDGSLGGFSLGGPDVKEFLLQTESRKSEVEIAA